MSGHVLLIGMMGAGKTTVGEAVAARLGWPYRDSDADVMASTGKSVPELFETEGEVAFRRAESDVLAQACASPEPSVISVAGGAVLAEANQEVLRQCGTVVWLRARPETLVARVGDGAGRPLLDRDPVGTLTRLSAERAPLYQSLADLIIDVDDLSADAVAASIVAQVAA